MQLSFRKAALIKRGVSILQNLRNLYRLLQFLLSSPLPAFLKGKVLRTAILLAARQPHSTSGGAVRARVIDFDVVAPSLSLLRLLHAEIFISLAYFFKADKAEPFILDCGSNIGMSILFFKALYPKARIVGFEPEEHTYTFLQRNISLNRLTKVQVHQAALGAEERVVDF